MLMHVASESNGKQRLLFTLKQVEYLQYYIHEMRLGDPEWVQYMLRVQAKTTGSEATTDPIAEEPPPPPGPEAEKWIPLPRSIYRKDAFTALVNPVIAVDMRRG